MKIILDNPPCYGRGELFIPDRDDRLGQDIAVLLCTTCPYRVECAEQGRRHPDTDSIRAGVRMWEDFAAFRLIDIIRTETP